MNANHNDLCTGAPRLCGTAPVAPAVLAWLVATLLLLGGAPPGHAQADSEPVLGTVGDRTFLAAHTPGGARCERRARRRRPAPAGPPPRPRPTLRSGPYPWRCPTAIGELGGPWRPRLAFPAGPQPGPPAWDPADPGPPGGPGAGRRAQGSLCVPVARLPAISRPSATIGTRYPLAPFGTLNAPMMDKNIPAQTPQTPAVVRFVFWLLGAAVVLAVAIPICLGFIWPALVSLFEAVIAALVWLFEAVIVILSMFVMLKIVAVYFKAMGREMKRRRDEQPPMCGYGPYGTDSEPD